MAKRATPIIVANWKMNGLLLESMQMFKKLRSTIHNDLVNCEIVICPPFTLLRDLAEKTPDTGVKLGGQNCSHEKNGAFTGEISAQMLADMTCDYVILGHSERRSQLNESSEIIRKKVERAHKESLRVILCVGESQYERDNNLAEETIEQQLTYSLPESANSDNTVIAYEPVWSIGTNTIPSHQQIAQMHQFILHTLTNKKQGFSQESTTIIYGGSANETNAAQIVAIQEVGGLLVGRASLDADSFWGIIQAASKNFKVVENATC